MTRSKKEIDYQVAENEADILVLQERLKWQADTNKTAADVLEKSAICFDEMDKEIRLLKKMATGLVFISGGIFVLLMKSKAEIREIQKVMNER